ncbi:MAG: hypothetical protein JJ896_12460 [Rhodothermales bacterium]|nr:hypothetical protein [Rhodothermales bacterium]MBO6780458.1 hypothetical protein [Rhodothermales bacterium]
MARIPAAEIVSESTASGGGNASRKVLKSRLLHHQGDVILVNPTTAPLVETERSAPPTVDRAPVRPGTEQVQEALAAAEKNFERRLAGEIAKAQQIGYERGLAEGQAAGAAERGDREAFLRAIAEGFDRAWETMASNSEPLLAELSARMTEAILECPLPESVRNLSTAALSDAIEGLGETRSVTVTVHPADYMMLEESGILGPLSQNHPNLNWRTDAKLDRGDWEARTDAAVVRRVARELLSDLRDRLGHLDEDNA